MVNSPSFGHDTLKNESASTVIFPDKKRVIVYGVIKDYWEFEGGLRTKIC